MDMVAWTTLSFMMGSLMVAVIMYALNRLYDRRDYLSAWGHYWTVLGIAYGLLYVGIVREQAWFGIAYLWVLVASAYVFYRATMLLLGLSANRRLEGLSMAAVALGLILVGALTDDPVVLLACFAAVPIGGFVIGGVLFIRRGDLLARVVGVLALVLGVNYVFFIMLSSVESLFSTLSLVTGSLGFLFASSIVLLYVHEVNKAHTLMRDTLTYKSYHDALTGLQNRTFFEEQLPLIDSAETWPLTLLMIDMNHLKEVNDRHGHRLGDRMLMAVANVLATHTRPQDLLVRHGGDEFLMVLTKTTLDVAHAIKSRIQHETKQHVFKGVPCTVAIGLACKRDASMTHQAWYDEAERMMYKDKETA